MDITEKIKEDMRNKNRSRKTSAKAADAAKLITEHTGNTIVKQYFNTVKQPIQKQPDISIGYQDIEKVVVEINTVQREFEKIRKRADAKGLQSLMIKSYDSIMKVAGINNPQYSSIDIFDKQIYNVSCLNQLLGAIVMNSSNELETIKDRHNTIISNSESYFNELRKLEKNLPGLIDQLNEKKEKFSAMNPFDDKYFSIERDVVRLERDLDEAYGRYNIVKQNYLGTSRHKENLHYMESLFRISLNNAGNLVVITKQIGDTLVDNQKVFSQTKNLVYASAAVSQGLDVLSEQNRQLNDEFISGVRGIQELSYNNDNVKMIESSNYSLRKLVESAMAIDYKQHMLTDKMLQES